MIGIIRAFSDEISGLSKEAGIGKAVIGKAIAPRNALRTLFAAGILGTGAIAGYRGYKRGRAMGQRARYLKATRHGPSRAAYIPWSKVVLRRKELSRAQKRRLHEHHRPSAMKRKKSNK